MKFVPSLILLHLLKTFKTSEGLFVEQPENTSVVENETAIFKCQVSNTSFKIHWIVDDTAANFQIIKDRGVTIVSINTSTSHLHIIGHKENNNTRVQCAGRLFDGYRVVEYVQSDVVILRIFGQIHVIAQSNTHQETYTTTSSIYFKDTITPIPSQISPTAKPQEMKWVTLLGAIGGVVFFLIVLLIIVSFIIVCKHRTKVRNTKQRVYYDTVLYDKPERVPSSDVKNLDTNISYEKPQLSFTPTRITCKDNPSYMYVVPVSK